MFIPIPRAFAQATALPYCSVAQTPSFGPISAAPAVVDCVSSLGVSNGQKRRTSILRAIQNLASACILIGSIDTAASAGVAQSTSTSFKPEQTQAICHMNFSPGSAPLDSGRSNYSTWTMYDGGDGAHAAFARAKSRAAASTGMVVTSERYFGKQGQLGISVTPDSSLSINGNQVLSMQVDMDDGMGVISVSMQTENGQLLAMDAAEFTMCSMVAAATQTPAPPSPGADGEERKPIFSNPFRKKDASSSVRESQELQRNVLDALYKRAAQAGKAFVVMPVLDMDTKYREFTTKQLQTEHLAAYFADGTSHSIWRSVQGGELSAGPWTASYAVGLHGFWGSVVVGKSNYALYMLDPGTYELKAASIERRGGILPTTNGNPMTARGIGTITAVKTLDRFFTVSTKWQDPVYTTQYYDQSYCVQEIAASGRCVTWDTQRLSYQQQAWAGGFKDKIEKNMVPGLTTLAELSKSFASFTVASGEVALVDGFVFDRDSAAIGKDSCKPAGDAVTCALTELGMLRIASSPEDLRQGLAQIKGDSPARAIFSAAKPAVLQVNASPLADTKDDYEAGWARRYVFSVKPK